MILTTTMKMKEMTIMMKLATSKEKKSIFMRIYLQTNQTSKALDIIFDQLHRIRSQPLLDYSIGVYYGRIGKLKMSKVLSVEIVENKKMYFHRIKEGRG